MKTLLFSLCTILLSFSHSVKAQSLTPMVVSPGGSFNSNGGYTLSQTIGEMTMVETFTSGTSILTQGIQQPAAVGVGVKELQNPLIAIDIFPNPGQGNFQLNIKVPKTATMLVRVIDILGRLVLTIPEQRIDENFRQVLDLTGKSNGTYMVQLSLFDDAGAEIYRQARQLHLIK